MEPRPRQGRANPAVSTFFPASTLTGEAQPRVGGRLDGGITPLSHRVVWWVALEPLLLTRTFQPQVIDR